jgi:hypothetical protein
LGLCGIKSRESRAFDGFWGAIGITSLLFAEKDEFF